MKKLSTILLLVLLLVFTSCQKQIIEEHTTEAEGVELISIEETELIDEKAEETTLEEKTTPVETTTEAQITTEVKTTKDQPTTAAPVTNVQTTEAARQDACTISINCSTINDNLDSLKKGKASFVPSNGIILSGFTVEVLANDTAFDILKRACEKNNIQFEYEYTPAFGNYYIEGINQLYEKDCGMFSGWLYRVNGEFASVGCSEYKVKKNDNIEFIYTCDMGEDIGASF